MGGAKMRQRRPFIAISALTLLPAALPIVIVLIATSASAQVPHDCPRHPNARYKTVESAEVKERLGRLARYYDHYPCERVDGKTVYELIRSKFVAMADAKEWQRLLLAAIRKGFRKKWAIWDQEKTASLLSPVGRDGEWARPLAKTFYTPTGLPSSSWSL
jgi:hypothetical protein